MVPALVAGVALTSVGVANAAQVSAATLTVTTTTDEMISGDGLCSLREAVAAVNAPGTATDCGTASHTSNTIVLPASSTPYALSIAPTGADDNSSGDLNVTGTTPLTISGAGQSASVIDATGLGDRVLSIATGATVALQKLEITGGHAPDGAAGRPCSRGHDAGTAGAGGGIYNAGKLSLIGVGVVGNTAGGGGNGGAVKNCLVGGRGGRGANGGGIYNAGTLKLTDSAILDNNAGEGGQGGGPPCFYHCPGNGGSGGAGGAGGGIYSTGRAAKLTVTKSTVAGNLAGGGGSIGFFARDGAGGQGGGGGAIAAAGGLLHVTNSTLAGNDAGNGGGGGRGGDGGNGGAIKITTQLNRSLVQNATIANNGAGAGGEGEFAGHAGFGGGLDAVAPGVLTMRNTIVASNNANGAANCFPSFRVAGGHDLSYGDSSCPGGNGNPELLPLADYGGPTQTMALGSGSAAIDQVPATGANCPTTDQRGVKRPQGPACDIGAFEFASPTVKIATPAKDANYQQGQNVVAAYKCSEGGITSPIASTSGCVGTVPNGQPIDTSSPGSHSFTVTATDKAGNTATKTTNYTVS